MVNIDSRVTRCLDAITEADRSDESVKGVIAKGKRQVKDKDLNVFLWGVKMLAFKIESASRTEYIYIFLLPKYSRTFGSMLKKEVLNTLLTSS